MFGCRSSAEIFASRMNIVLKSPVSESRGRMRFKTSSRSNPSGPVMSARKTSAIPPSPMRPSSL